MAKSAAKPKAKPKAKAKGKTATTKGKGGTATLATAVVQPGVERRRNHPLRAKNGYFQVLLTHPVPHLGDAGDLVKVRPGFARNYLLPLGFATYATPHNLRHVEKHRERLRAIEAAKRADLLNLAGQIAQRSIHIEVNANQEGHLYGSVTADMIADRLKQEHFPIEADNVKVEGSLKETGLYTIRIVLAQEIETEVKLWVVPTHTDET